jgi:hypothetical protein
MLMIAPLLPITICAIWASKPHGQDHRGRGDHASVAAERLGRENGAATPIVHAARAAR